MNKKHNEEEIKEDFCPSCLVMPLAFVGAGAVVAGNKIPNKHKKWKKAMLISGVATLVFLILLVIYYYVFQKGCDGTCDLKV
jgi:hypothetical protein